MRPPHGSLLRWCALLCCLLSACEFDAFMLDVGLFPGARETAVTQCCACLVGTRRDNEDISAGTSDCTEAGFTDAGATDANSACVCALPQSECEAQLLAGQRISVRGACTQADGVCAQDCENVLAYPD